LEFGAFVFGTIAKECVLTFALENSDADNPLADADCSGIFAEILRTLVDSPRFDNLRSNFSNESANERIIPTPSSICG
jgi:hypothetical protein